jgi:hypothetical protein
MKIVDSIQDRGINQVKEMNAILLLFGHCFKNQFTDSMKILLPNRNILQSALITSLCVVQVYVIGGDGTQKGRRSDF